MRTYLPTIAALGLLSFGAALTAADHGVVADLKVAKVVDNKGHQMLQSPKSTAPGDVVEYLVTYTNTWDTPARGVYGTISIPPNKYVYVANTAAPGILEASVDGRTFGMVPLMRLVPNADGTLKQEEIPASEYRYLRWNIGSIPAWSSVVVKAQLRVREQNVQVASAH